MGAVEERRPVALVAGLALVGLLLATLVAYAAVGRVGFIYDELFGIVRNPFAWSLRGSLDAWAARSLDGAGEFRGLWRPLLMMSYGVNAELCGLEAACFKWTDLWIHLLFVTLVFLLLRRGSASAPLALWVAGLTALHPLNTEAVVYTWARSTQLATLAMVGAVLLHDRAARAAGRRAWALRLAGALLMAAGMMCKELAVVALAWIVLFDVYAWRRHGGRFEMGRHVWSWTPYLAVVVLYLAWRWVHIGGLGQTEPVRAVGAWRSLLTQSTVIVRYLYMVVDPRQQSLWWDVAFVSGWDAPGVLPALGLLCLLFALGAWLLWRGRLEGWGLLWFFFALAPTSSIVPITITMQEYRLYPALPGLFLALGAWVVSPGGRRPPRMVLGPLALALLALAAVATHHRVGEWTDVERFVEGAYEAAPGSPKAARSLAAFRSRQGRLVEARDLYRLSVVLSPNDPRAWRELARASLDLGRRAEAYRTLLRATALHGLDPEVDLGWVHFNLEVGNLVEAERRLRRILRDHPRSVAGTFLLARIEAAKGEGATALALFRRVTRLDPRHLDAWGNLGVAALEAGRVAEARAIFRRLARWYPSNQRIEASLAALGER